MIRPSSYVSVDATSRSYFDRRKLNESSSRYRLWSSRVNLGDFRRTITTTEKVNLSGRLRHRISLAEIWIRIVVLRIERPFDTTLSCEFKDVAAGCCCCGSCELTSDILSSIPGRLRLSPDVESSINLTYTGLHFGTSVANACTFSALRVYIASFWATTPDRLWNRDTNLRHDWVRPRVHAFIWRGISLLRYSQAPSALVRKALLFLSQLASRVVSRFLPSPSVWSRSRRPCLRWCSETTALLTFLSLTASRRRHGKRKQEGESGGKQFFHVDRYNCTWKKSRMNLKEYVRTEDRGLFEQRLTKLTLSLSRTMKSKPVN
jgi:hypothetical protein